MNKYYYDMHLHSCLSPCGDNDMTPNNIAGMAALAGLNIVALTDHNTTENCPAFFEAAARNGIIPVAGMELTTAEDIHVVCLFEELENAMRFNEFIKEHRMKIPNRTDIFGDQLILDGQDEVIGSDAFFLPAATDITVEEAPGVVKRFSGICYPAHIDREANGIIATLGAFPDAEGFRCFELHDASSEEEYKQKYPVLEKRLRVVSSDAHYLEQIRDKDAFFELNDEPYSSANVRHELFDLLGGIIS